MPRGMQGVEPCLSAYHSFLLHRKNKQKKYTHRQAHTNLTSPAEDLNPLWSDYTLVGITRSSTNDKKVNGLFYFFGIFENQYLESSN